MIRAVLVMNTQGEPRLAKFCEFLFRRNQPAEKQQELIRSVFAVLCSRAENVSNFVEAESIFGPDSRIVYKHFATLYFVFVFDSSENELAVLDLIQVFVETLDKCFKNVCEIDIVFNYSKLMSIAPRLQDPTLLDGRESLLMVLGGSLAIELMSIAPRLQDPTLLDGREILLMVLGGSLAIEIHTILDEIILGGQVLETSSTEVMKAVEEISKLEAASDAITLIPKSASGWRSR